jgi:glycosyltransferase involved in cell wall biosynthesis
MRILFLSTWFPYPPDNGSKLRAYYLANSLAEQHEVTVVAFRPQSSEPWNKDEIQTGRLSVVTVPDDPYNFVGLPQWRKYISPSPLAFRASLPMQTVVALQAHRPWDAVVAVQMPVAQYALRIDAAARIIDVDTALAYQLRDRYRCERRRLARSSHWISWQKALRYEKAMLRHFSVATVVWQAEADYLRQMVGDAACQVAIVPNGVDTVSNQPGLAAHHPDALVYNGSLTYSANYDAMHWFLAEIYPLIKMVRPHVRLTITGSINGVNLAGLALDDSVQLTGFVPDVRIPVAEAAVCVVPLRRGGGTRLKILEAMALGTPVVSTTKGAEGHVAAHGEHLLLADTPGEFARATLALLEERALRTRLSEQARCLVVDRYDWARIGRQFAALVEGAVRGQQPAREHGLEHD